MPSRVSSSSTSPCACAQSPLASHHRAQRVGGNPAGGSAALVEPLNSAIVILRLLNPNSGSGDPHHSLTPIFLLHIGQFPITDVKVQGDARGGRRRPASLRCGGQRWASSRGNPALGEPFATQTESVVY